MSRPSRLLYLIFLTTSDKGYLIQAFHYEVLSSPLLLTLCSLSLLSSSNILSLFCSLNKRVHIFTSISETCKNVSVIFLIFTFFMPEMGGQKFLKALFQPFSYLLCLYIHIYIYIYICIFLSLICSVTKFEVLT